MRKKTRTIVALKECALTAGSHVRRKRKSKRKRRLHAERKRKQNEMRMCTSVSQDGGTLVSRVRVTLDQQSVNEDSGNERRTPSWFEHKP